MEVIDDSELPDDEPSKTSKKSSKDTASMKEICIVRPVAIREVEEMKNDARHLSFEQKVVFNIMIDFCKRIKILKTGWPIDINPPRLIVTGKLS